jgi:phosphatidylglycerophosphate synthase
LFVATILGRELIVSGFRMVAASKGVVLAADKSGKIKTFVQDVAIIVLLVSMNVNPANVFYVAGLVILGVATLLTIISGTECIVKNFSIIKSK